MYFIAKMSANHGSGLDTALRIVCEAKAAGADCLKIQTYTVDTMMLNYNKPDFMVNSDLWDGYDLYKLYEYTGPDLFIDRVGGSRYCVQMLHI